MSVFDPQFIVTAFIIMVRVTSVIMAAPFFGSMQFPVRVKVFFALSVTLLLYPVIPLQGVMVPLDATNLEVVILIVKEMLIGVAMGLAGQIVFGGIQFGGQFISIQTGLGFANIIDPNTQTQNPIISQVMILLGIVLFLAIGGDAIYLRALKKSFEIVPLGTATFAESGPEFIKMATQIFVIGIQLSAPFIIVLFLMDLSFAIFARIMPQANIFFISMPLKVLAGILMLLWVVPKLGIAFNQFFQVLFKFLERIILAV
ncbi:flagellar biosynthetic protein FliR [bacterium]|nr:MAG: flagellar biosynthetic protein FliR [bacterium]